MDETTFLSVILSNSKDISDAQQQDSSLRAE